MKPSHLRMIQGQAHDNAAALRLFGNEEPPLPLNVHPDLAGDIRALRASGLLFLNNPNAPLTAEQLYYLDVLQAGRLPINLPGFPQGVPLAHASIRDAGLPIYDVIGRVPDPSLLQSWSKNQLITSGLIEPIDAIADAVRDARAASFGNALVVDPNTAGHVEALDFTKPENLREAFFYLENRNLHFRRIEMLADLAIYGIRKGFKNGIENVHVVNFGPGVFPLERKVINRLTPAERKRVIIVAVDVSEDLLRYGLFKGYADRGSMVEVSSKDAEDLKQLFPRADVVIYADILEHIDHAASIFKRKVIPWLRHTGALLLGSVPNAVQLAEYVPMFIGLASSHQLHRPLIDEVNDHHSHHTAASLAEILRVEWGFRESGIVSNGVRIAQHGDDAHLLAGLSSPQLGDRLIFWAHN